MASWKHNEKNRNDTISDPTNNQFFSNETVGSLSNALIREGIQNNLDEIKDATKPVRVRVFLSGEKYAVTASDFEECVKDLLPHLMADGNGIIPSDLPDFSKPVKFLLFEDFNTKGLEGDPLEYKFDAVRDKGKPHNFYFFWRAYGVSGKLGGKMGSWGVGKSVFPASSAINCYFALTVRESDKKAYLIGQSVLKTHNLKDKPTDCGYFPYGTYATYDPSGFATPEDSSDEINRMGDLFHIRRDVANVRARAENTGLSIVIPFPKAELSVRNLVLATIQQFFYPIMLGMLEVEIAEEDAGCFLSKDTLKSEVEKIDISILDVEEKDNLLRLLDFTTWIINLKQEDVHDLTFESIDRAFEWRKKELFSKLSLKELQEEFEKGTPLAFRVPMKYTPEGQQSSFRFFHAYIQKDKMLQDPANYFIRDYLSIVGIKSLRKKGVRGLALISDKDLVTFFGQAEGPAHTGWHKANFRIKYENIEECISFVQHSLERIYSALLMPSEGLDKTLLQDFFFIQDEQDSQPRGGAGKTGKKKTPTKVEVPESRPKYVIVNQIKDGFRVTKNPNVPYAEREFEIRVAYDRFDGNPFKKYSEFDFNLKSLKVNSQNVRNIKLDKNILCFEPDDGDFEVSVTCFHSKRDIVVDIK